MADIFNVANQIKQVMANEEWRYDYDEEKHQFSMGFNIDGKLANSKLRINVVETGITCYAYVAQKVDEGARPAVLEYIARANYGLRQGNFELDVRDGEVRYKAFISTRGLNGITPEMVKEAILIPLNMLERYGDGLVAVMYGFSDPKTEIEKAEAD